MSEKNVYFACDSLLKEFVHMHLIGEITALRDVKKAHMSLAS